MNIYGLIITTDHVETILELNQGSSFRIVDSYTPPDAVLRDGVMLNSTFGCSLGIQRQLLAIDKYPNPNDNSTLKITVAVLTDQSTVNGKLKFQPNRQGTVSITIGNSTTNCDTFTTTASDVAYFSLKVDKSWGRPQNPEE